MTSREKLRHAPRARAAYDHFVYEHKRARRLDTAVALLTIGALVGFASLIPFMWFMEWLP